MTWLERCDLLGAVRAREAATPIRRRIRERAERVAGYRLPVSSDWRTLPGSPSATPPTIKPCSSR